MPTPSSLAVGDRVRLLHVPAADLQQRERELLTAVDMPGWTADTLEQLMAINPVVMIDRIDEYGIPWFTCELPASDGATITHHLAIMDDASWEKTT